MSQHTTVAGNRAMFGACDESVTACMHVQGQQYAHCSVALGCEDLQGTLLAVDCFRCVFGRAVAVATLLHLMCGL